MCTTCRPAPSTAPPTPAAGSTRSAPGGAARALHPRGRAGGGPPAAELLTRHEWADRRDTLCEELALDPNPATIIDQLTASLDAAWRRTAAGYADNADLRIEHRGGRDEI